MSAFQEIVGSVSRQKEEVLSQESRDELKDAVLQLVGYHHDNTVAVSEVTDLLASSNCQIKDILKSCICVDNNSETGSLQTLDHCVNTVLKLAKDMQSQDCNTDIKEQILKQVLVIQEVVDRQAFNQPRLLNLLCNEMTLPVYLIWVLKTEGVMALNTYLSFKNSSQDFAKAFTDELYDSISLYNEDSWCLDILSQLVQSSLSAQKDTDSLNIKKISKHILELLNQKILDELSLNGGTVKVVDLTKFCPVDLLKQYYQGLISLWLGYRPVLKVADALKQQKDWIFSKLSPSLKQWYKQCLVVLEPGEVLEQIKVVMDSQEVNWQTVLSFLSTALVCMPQFSNLVQDYIVSLLCEGLETSNLENLVIAFLFARQSCFEGPNVFSSYPDWFQGVFSEASSTPAANRKTFTCLIKFLTDMVPFESSSHLKAHIVRPPFVPPKCRELLTDYILLAKTRLADLKHPLDGVPEEDQDVESRKKVNEQIEDDIQKAVVLFQSSKKIPSSIMEASIFRKPYYVGKFLPVLLKPRALPDIPDLRMKFIDALKQVDKIPSTLYTNYLKACQAESARLLEGVFLEEDMDLELSDEEQLQLCLDELLKVILDNPTNRVVEQCSLLREKLRIALHIEGNKAEMCSSEPSTLLNVNAADISSQQIKVVDQLLEFLASACQRGVEMSATVSWPQDLFSILREVVELHNAIFIRIWKLIMEQGSDLHHHHLRTLSFCLAHLDLLNSQETTVQLCQGSCQVHRGNFAHLVWQELPISTSSFRKLSFCLMLECIDFVSCLRKSDVFQYLLPSVFCDKFQFLYGYFKDLSPGDQVFASFGQLNEEIKSVVFRTRLAFKDWVQFEMEVTFPDDRLSISDWQVHVYNTVFNSYILEESLANGSIIDNNRKISGELFTKLLQQEMSMKSLTSPGCKDCTRKEVVKHTGETHIYFISVLQTLISYLKPGDREASWLAEQIQEEMVRRDSDLDKESCIQAIFRMISWLPAYRLFADSPRVHLTLELPCQIINQTFTRLCRCGYFPARETLYMLEGLSQLENGGDVDTVLQKCPLLSLSVVVHSQFTRNLITEIYNKHTNAGLQDLLKITDWVESCKSRPALFPCELEMNVLIQSAGLLSLLHTKSVNSLREIIGKQARSSDGRQDKIFEGLAVLLVTELNDVKSHFCEEAEQALEHLLLSKPALLSCLAGGIGDLESVLPENVLRQMPFTLLKFLLRRKSPSWQSSLTYLSSVLLFHKRVLQYVDLQVPSENLVTMNDWIDLVEFLKGCFNSATKAQLKNVSEELLSDCGADIVLMYKQAIAREH